MPHWGCVMAFIQIVEYETDRADEMQALMDESEQVTGQERGYERMMVTQDRDNPNHYLVIVEFPSYEVAMANSRRPETDQFAKQMAEFVTSGPTYHNLEVRMRED